MILIRIHIGCRTVLSFGAELRLGIYFQQELAPKDKVTGFENLRECSELVLYHEVQRL